jgi:acyltransferase
MSASVHPPSAQRAPGLDAARAFAVAAMVFGHTAEATLSPLVRALPAVQTYWGFRGLTAPLFLFVAGWAVITVVERSGLSGWAVVRARLPRVLLLFGFGVFLRFPGWDLGRFFAFDKAVWRHFLGFDALHCVGASLLLGSIVLALTRRFTTRAVALVGLTIVLPLMAGAVASFALSPWMPMPLQNALVAHRTSPFPIFPWAGYFFAGAATGLLLHLIAQRWARAVALVTAGAVITFGAWWVGLADLTQTSPVLFAWRLGQVLVIASLAMVLPLALSSRLTRLGRASLIVYVAHLPVVYGWSTFPGLNSRLGRTLELWQVFLIAAALLVMGLLLAHGIDLASRWLRAGGWRGSATAEPVTKT